MLQHSYFAEMFKTLILFSKDVLKGFLYYIIIFYVPRSQSFEPVVLSHRVKY